MDDFSYIYATGMLLTFILSMVYLRNVTRGSTEFDVVGAVVLSMVLATVWPVSLPFIAVIILGEL